MHLPCLRQQPQRLPDVRHGRNLHHDPLRFPQQGGFQLQHVRFAVREGEHPAVPFPPPGRVDIKGVRLHLAGEFPCVSLHHPDIAGSQHGKIMGGSLAIGGEPLHVSHLRNPLREIKCVHAQSSRQVAATAALCQRLLIAGCRLRRTLLCSQARRVNDILIRMPRRQFLPHLPPCEQLLHGKRHVDFRVTRGGKQQLFRFLRRVRPDKRFHRRA